MRIDASGNVGIGTSSPASPLSVYNASNPYANFADAANYLNVGVITSTYGLINSSLPISFQVSDVERMRIDSSGNLAIANGNQAAGAVSSRIMFGNKGTFTTSDVGRAEICGVSEGALWYSGTALAFYTNPGPDVTGTVPVERMRIDASGNLLLGTTSVAGIGTSVSENNGKCLIIQNTSTVSANTMTQFKNPNGIVGQIICTGSTTAYNTSSDQRLKENITDANDAGNKIDAIKVRQYDWKADGSHQDYGMVAQELMTVAPEAVSGDPESDEMMGVDYSKLVPMMLKEIQSLRARISQLEGAN